MSKEKDVSVSLIEKSINFTDLIYRANLDEGVYFLCCAVNNRYKEKHVKLSIDPPTEEIRMTRETECSTMLYNFLDYLSEQDDYSKSVHKKEYDELKELLEYYIDNLNSTKKYTSWFNLFMLKNNHNSIVRSFTKYNPDNEKLLFYVYRHYSNVMLDNGSSSYRLYKNDEIIGKAVAENVISGMRKYLDELESKL